MSARALRGPSSNRVFLGSRLIFPLDAANAPISREA
jgi:hypothetical protein